MWWAKSDAGPVTAWLGCNRVAWWDHAGSLVKAARVEGLEEGWTWLKAAAAEKPSRQPIRLRLDGDLCTLETVEAWAGAETAELAEAALNAARADGAREQAAVVRLARWPQPGSRWMVVRHKAALHEQALTVFGRGLVSIKPWYHAVVPPVASAVVFFDGYAVTQVVLGESGEPQRVATVPNISDEAAALKCFRRLSAASERSHRAFVLRWGAAADASRPVSTGQEPYLAWVEDVALG